MTDFLNNISGVTQISAKGDSNTRKATPTHRPLPLPLL